MDTLCNTKLFQSRRTQTHTGYEVALGCVAFTAYICGAHSLVLDMFIAL